jgi:hypothetical protein
MVHGFSATDGSEVFAYVPSMFLPMLENLTATPYQFTYYADGEIRYREISSTQHIVTGGFGAGAKGLFALDVSTPANPRMLFELAGTDAGYIAGEHANYIGHIYGRPTIARLPDNNWYIVSGNGYGSGQTARLVLIRLSDGARTTILTNDASPTNGLSAPALVDVNGDGKANIAYAGDLNGNMWRFDLANNTASLLFAAGAGKPITIEPDVARHPSGIGIMVYFGTGKVLSQADMTTTGTQSFFGIWDEDFVATDLAANRLLVQTLEEQTDTWAGNERTVRIVRNEATPVWEGDNRNLGWRVDFPLQGERLIGRPQVRAERIQFVTTNPTSDPMSNEPGDGSWYMQLSLESGGSLSPAVPLYDLDRSGVLDAGDALSIDIDDADGVPTPTPFYPLALNLGPGNIAQPAFARVRQDIDAVFINALLLPPPEDPRLQAVGFGGDLDVMTDSPSGPLVNPHSPSHPKFDLYGTAYPDPSNDRSGPARGPMNIHLAADGAGNRMDGHHRAYDKVHGVDYVDFFDIEPRARRSQLRLDPGTLHTYTDADGNVITGPFTAIRELNQPAEDVNGNAMISDTQKFIVVLTNADLSQGVELQIGCRKWPSFVYQEMITPKLKAGVLPASLTDEQGESLVFTLEDIKNDTGCDNPTLRLTVTGRVGAEDVMHGTLPGCVNNTHQYTGEVKEAGTHPHITDNQEKQSEGYRIRNGALTMQLLQVGPNNERQYVLQPTSQLPTSKQTLGKGGIYANAFTVAKVQGKDVFTLVTAANGLLYEASVFWNFGDMWEFQQQGQPVACYGASTYNAVTTNELGGLNKAQYDGLVEDLRLNDELRAAYAGALDALANAKTEEQVRAALMALAAIFEERSGDWGVNKDLFMSDYHRLRSYAHEFKFKLDLLDIDKDLFSPPPPVELAVDGTPATVQDIELDLLPAAGPNYAPGRRSWIDITPN